MPRKGIQLVFVLVGVPWLTIVSTGLWLLWGYENRPGKASEPPGEWPVQSRIQPSHDRPTLVMLAHPHCPCSRASVGELAAIMAHSQGPQSHCG